MKIKIRIISIKNGLIKYRTYHDSRINITTLAEFTERYGNKLLEVWVGKSEDEDV